jgi:RND family efflux transporter MFP subunit
MISFIHNSKPSLFVTALVVGAFATSPMLSGCKKADSAPTVAAPIQIGPESYAVAVEGQIESGPTISGTLVPRDQAVVRAQISGAVLRTFVDQGKPVHAGEVIAMIDNGALNDAVTSAKNAVTNAESAVALTHREQQRQETLLKSGAISEQSVDMIRQNCVTAEAGLAQAKSQLATAEKQLGYATVRAPFSGVVSEKSASIGDVVQQGTALYTIVDPSTLELQGTVPANALNIVHIGLTVAFDVTGYPDRNFVGTITRINPTADPMTRQVRIYAEIPNKGQALVGGLYAEGRIASILKTTLTLPADAVDHKTITPAVIRSHNGLVERATVTLGTLDEKNDRIEIISGIAAGDTVLRGSAMEITLGSRVMPEPLAAMVPDPKKDSSAK